MDLKLNINDLSDKRELAKLTETLSELADELDVMYTETAPNGAISARVGKIAIYKNGATYEQWQNVDGGTTWQRQDSGAVSLPFKTGDWIISSVNTARTGWTNVSATYTGKFMRVNATPKSTGGADTVTISANNLPTHTHTAGTLATASDGSHYHTSTGYSTGSSAGLRLQMTINNATSGTVDTDSKGAHTHAISGSTGDNTTTATAIDTVPAYITVCVFEKDA